MYCKSEGQLSGFLVEKFQEAISLCGQDRSDFMQAINRSK